jgi:hypothetical protein
MTENEKAGFYAYAIVVFIISILITGLLLR